MTQTLDWGTILKGTPVGEVPISPAGLHPSTLVAIMGPYPGKYGPDGHTTLDDTLDLCERSRATPVFIPDMISDEEKQQVGEVSGVRLNGMTAMRNWAVEQALEKGYDFLLLVENDVKVIPELLDDLIQADKGIIIPRLHYPTFPVASFLNYAPRPTPDQAGTMELVWAAHSIVLFRRDAMESIKPCLFRGYTTEGSDHIHWQQQGFPAFMCLDTVVDVLSLPLGEQHMLKIPFQVHRRNGKFCSGPVYEARVTKNVALYRCKVEGCGYEMFFRAPSKVEHKISEIIEPDVQLNWSMLQEHWEVRARNYQNLEWAHRQDYLDKVVEAVELQPDEPVLDAGTGTGIIAHALAMKVGKVVGIDISPDMIEKAKVDQYASEVFHHGDVRYIPYPANFFGKVFCRMVFHSLVDEGDVQKTTRECYRVLQPGGHFILSEGIPPHPVAVNWYTEMFKLKEERLTMSVEMMEGLLKEAGFKNVHTVTHITPECSVKNWLGNSGLSQARQDEIYKLHQEMDPWISSAYRAILKPDDVLINMHFAITVGEK